MARTPMLLLILLSVVFTSKISAQSPLHKAWILTKLEMVDSSSVIHHLTDPNPYVRYEFDGARKFKSSTSPIDIGDSFEYTLHSSHISIYNTLNSVNILHIEKLNHDTLILTEDNPQNLPADKIRRYYFIPEKTQIRNTLIGLAKTDTVVATPKVSPKLSRSFMTIVEKDFINLNIKKPISGKFFVSRQKMIVKIQDAGGYKESKVEKITKALEKLMSYWIFPETSESTVFVIEFYIESDIKKTYGHWYSPMDELTISKHQFFSFNIRLFKQSPDKRTNFSLETLGEIDAHYKNGAISFDDQNYDGAIKEFNACLQLYANHIDARYLRAYAYFKLSKLTEACSDLSFLAELNQKTAIQLQKEYCK